MTTYYVCSADAIPYLNNKRFRAVEIHCKDYIDEKIHQDTDENSNDAKYILVENLTEEEIVWLSLKCSYCRQKHFSSLSILLQNLITQKQLRYDPWNWFTQDSYATRKK